MKIAVLFDGAGLARLGLEQSGHECTGYELDPSKHYLSKFVGSGNCVLQDATTVNLDSFDAIWASPPCQFHSVARTQGLPSSEYSTDYLNWCLTIHKNVLWVENTINPKSNWGIKYNAAQFIENPIQCRNRMIGGNYSKPQIFRDYKKYYVGLNLCPTITATEYKGCKTDKRRASRFYGRKLTLLECAYHQGFEIPEKWLNKPEWFLKSDYEWNKNMYEAIGNGVPVYMAKAFGDVYK